MQDGSDRRPPREPHRAPDSIWERYLTGRLSLEDQDTLPALVKELHREIAQHLGQAVDAPSAAVPLDIDPPATKDPMLTSAPIVDTNARSAHLAERRRIEPPSN